MNDFDDRVEAAVQLWERQRQGLRPAMTAIAANVRNDRVQLLDELLVQPDGRVADQGVALLLTSTPLQLAPRPSVGAGCC